MLSVDPFVPSSPAFRPNDSEQRLPPPSAHALYATIDGRVFSSTATSVWNLRNGSYGIRIPEFARFERFLIAIKDNSFPVIMEYAHP